MLRLISFLSIGTWIGVVVEATLIFWPTRMSDTFQYAIILAVAVSGIVLASVTLARNRPFLVGFSFLLSIFGGILFGLVGVGVLFYGVISVLAPGSLDPLSGPTWLACVNNTIMAILPILWAPLWRDSRHATVRNT